MSLFRFCPSCGAQLGQVPEQPERISKQECAGCGAVHYRNAKPCAGALVVRDGKVLLGRRRQEPFKGWWDIPGGFLEPWELPIQAVVRELAEETGLEVRPTELLVVLVDRYGEAGDYTLNLHYLAKPVSGQERAGDDLVELAWFGPDELPEQIAFENGRAALRAWRERQASGQ